MMIMNLMIDTNTCDILNTIDDHKVRYCLMMIKVHYCDWLYCLAIQVKITWDHTLEI